MFFINQISLRMSERERVNLYINKWSVSNSSSNRETLASIYCGIAVSVHSLDIA